MEEPPPWSASAPRTCVGSTTPTCCPWAPTTPSTAAWTCRPARRLDAAGRTFLEVDPTTLTALVREAVGDISHSCARRTSPSCARSSTTRRRRRTTGSSRLDLLRNACVSAGGVLPMCQDTGTAIVVGKRTETVLTGGNDEEAISRGRLRGLRPAEPALLADGADDRSGTNATPAPTCPRRSSCTPRAGRTALRAARSWPRAAAPPNKTFLYQETKALLNPERLAAFLDEKLPLAGHGGLPAVPPGDRRGRHVGGVHAQDREAGVGALPRHAADHGLRHGHGFRDLELEQQVLELTRGSASARSSAGSTSATTSGSSGCRGTGPRCPVGDRGVVLGRPAGQAKITPDGVFLEQLERDPARFLPDVDRRAPRRRATSSGST